MRIRLPSWPKSLMLLLLLAILGAVWWWLPPLPRYVVDACWWGFSPDCTEMVVLPKKDDGTLTGPVRILDVSTGRTKRTFLQETDLLGFHGTFDSNGNLSVFKQCDNDESTVIRTAQLPS